MENPLNSVHSKKDNSRLLGLDVGEKRIGVALSDINWMIANPYGTIDHISVKKSGQSLQKIILDFNVQGLVVGLPKNMDGTEGPKAQSIRQFVKNIQDYLQIPTFFWDERLTSVQADRIMLEADVSRKTRNTKNDQVAACLILSNYLEYIKYQTK